MEELFRRAASNYPLSTDSADWETVEKKLPSIQIAATGDSLKNKQSRKGYLLILLLIPLVWLCNKYASDYTKENAPAQKVLKPKKDSLANYKAEVTLSASPDRVIISQMRVREEQPQNIQNAEPESKPADNFINSDRGVDAGQRNTTLSRSYLVKQRLVLAEVNLTAAVSEENKTDVQTTQEKTNIEDTASIKPEDKEIKRADSLAKIENKKVSDETKQKNKEAVRIKSSGYLYAGPVTGADLTTVKFQSIKNAGYSAGLLLGYQLNNKFSIESGVYYHRKYYYTDGKYFKSHYNTSSRKFTEVAGDCRMLEVPVNIKYNFISRRRSGWFITSGISAYFMQNEKYDYTYLAWGQQYKAFYNNKNAASFLFSNVNLSIGHTQHIGKSITLRIEPYFRFPLKGIGSGKLPITSSGVYVGFSKRMW